MGEIGLLQRIQTCLTDVLPADVVVGFDVGPARRLDCCACDQTMVWIGLLETFNYDGDLQRPTRSTSPCTRPKASVIEVKFAVCVPDQLEQPCGPSVIDAAASAAEVVAFAGLIEQALQTCGQQGDCGDALIDRQTYTAVEGGNCRIVTRRATFPLGCTP